MMKRRHSMGGGVVAALAVMLLVVSAAAQELTGEASAAFEPGANLQRCRDLGGTWVTDIGGLHTSVEAWIPLDPDGRRYTVITEVLDFDPSFGGLLPAVQISTFRGQFERTGPRDMEGQITAFGLDVNNNIVYQIVGRWQAHLVACDEMEMTGTMGVYGAHQDPFGDEPPYFGCVPGEGFSQRVPEWQGCTPTP